MESYKKLKQPKETFPPLRHADGKWAHSDLEKASIFAEHLSNVFTPHPYSGSDEHIDTITSFLSAPPSSVENVSFSKMEGIPKGIA